MSQVRNALAGLLSLFLAGCGGGGSDGGASSTCDFIGGNANSVSSPGGYTHNVDAVADGSLATFASVLSSPGSGGYVDAGRGVSAAQFPGGTNAGVFVTPPAGVTSADITLSTFLDPASQSGETATGPALTFTATNGDPATYYISFQTTAPFKGVKMTFNTPNAGEYLVYEFCGAATVR